MNNALLIILTIVGMFAIYWVLIGQWKNNKLLAEEPKNESPDKTK